MSVTADPSPLFEHPRCDETALGFRELCLASAVLPAIERIGLLFAMFSRES